MTAPTGVLHNGVLMAIVAHGLIGISLVWDKVLLKRPQTKNLASYVFWLGFISVFGLCLIPFGYTFPGYAMAGLAFGTGIIHLVANYLYYGALKQGEASETLAMMGGFSPVLTALIGIPLLAAPLGGKENLAGFVLMVSGGFVMFFSEKISLSQVMGWVLSASAAFGLVNVLEKVVFNHTNFVSGYVFFTVGTFAGSLLLLVWPPWRRQIFEYSEDASPRSKAWYMVNRFMAGVGSFLIFYAVSLDSPAIVESITGIRYVLIFLGAYFITKWRPQWLRENFTGWVLIAKSIATALVVAGLVLLGLSSEENGHNANSTTPQATTVAPNQRCRLMRSPNKYFARIVSRM
jgi:drug/metabolite transporter (DMT)-like permease